MVVAVDSSALESAMAMRLHQLCDAHLSLALHGVWYGVRVDVVSMLTVKKMADVGLSSRNTVYFRVNPELAEYADSKASRSSLCSQPEHNPVPFVGRSHSGKGFATRLMDRIANAQASVPQSLDRPLALAIGCRAVVRREARGGSIENSVPPRPPEGAGPSC